jgi:xanthine dehydrogenase accessory factor
MSWAAYALDLLSRGKPAAMVTLVHVAGSVPRDAGTRMIVTTDAIFGTIGGGNLELQLMNQARRLMAQGAVGFLQQDYPLGPLLAQCCGGRVRVLIERLDAISQGWLAIADEAEREGKPYTLEGVAADGAFMRSISPGWTAGASEGVDLFARSGIPAGQKEDWSRVVERVAPAATPLYLFGAGHVGRAIAHIAETLPFRLHWFDTRPEAMEQSRVVLRKELLPIVGEAEPGAFFLVVTHAHELDYSLVRAILARGDAEFCGLIGSATKRARFVSRLARDGIDAGDLICPIGAGIVRSKAPAAIAVAVAVELLVLVETRTARKAQGFAAPNPPPPGVSITNTSPAPASTLSVAPSATISPFARRR